MRHFMRCCRSLVVTLVPVLVLVLAPTSLDAQSLDVLVFTRTEGFTHTSITDGVTMMQELVQEEGWTLEVTDQTTLFTPSGLAGFDVAVWLSTTGDVLDEPEQDAFEAYVRGGGAWVGIHAAADCEYGWPWYGELLGNGAWFDSHPAIQDATLVLESPAHPGAGGFGPTTTFRDEWYNFAANPRPAVEVVLTLDESSYDPGAGAMGPDHPIAWAHEIDAGRAFYTGLGHRSQTFAEPAFREQIRGAVRWAGRVGELFADDFESGDLSAWSSDP